MAVQYIQARVTNPGKPGKAHRTVSEKKKMAKKRGSSKRKIVISVGPRKRNPAKKRSLLSRARRGAGKIGSRTKTIVLGAPKRKRNPAKKRRTGAAKKRSLGGIVLHRRRRGSRKHNPSRRRRAVKRRRNPGFDVKSSLISVAVLLGGTFLAAKAVPWIETKLAAMDTFKDPKTLGYVMLAGAAATIVGGEYLQKKFGSSKFDLAPAAYAIATYMALRGFRKTEILDAASPQAGLSYGGMDGTMIFDTGRASNPGLAYGGMSGLPAGYSMLGSILSNDQLPAPAVGPHNVMQGYGGYTPSLV